MNIVWFSWKDTSHPESGGAEVVSGELMKNLIADGHSVRLITARYKNSPRHDTLNGLDVVRVGNRFTVYVAAAIYYLRHLRKTTDIVIDEMNTIPFSSGIYAKSTKRVLLTYQLAREVWFYQMPFPLSVIGYLFEPFMLRLISRSYDIVLTESKSTEQDLKKYGFKNIHLFRVGMHLNPLAKLPVKKTSGKILSLGAVRPMKRTLDAIKAFETARDQNNTLTLTLAGDISSAYASKVMAYIEQSRHNDAIDVRGRVGLDEKTKLMTASDVILVTSIKEGWGLIVTEANSQGTPAITYDADGLRDSVRNNATGYLCKSGDYVAMGNLINKLINDDTTYESMRTEAWKYSKQFTFKNSYADFSKAIDLQ
jgi:glycosyltransferase involved in cell wall biosynthesis